MDQIKNFRPESHKGVDEKEGTVDRDSFGSSRQIRNGRFDVVIAAGPNLNLWPSIGVKTISTLCAEMGLSVGQFGPEALNVKGIIPSPSTGGTVLVEDIQNRIHRIQTRAIVKLAADFSFPDPFPGWSSPGLIPLSTAKKLFLNSKVEWDTTTVILGTGNQALHFGSKLLESGASEVICVESKSHLYSKRIAGWEVERRYFEMNGGKIVEAKPIQLVPKSPLVWQLRLQDAQGIRIIDVGRVVSAGPFCELPGVREYPSGSLLFEFDQTASEHYAENTEGWVLEEERATLLAGKIIKALTSDLGDQKELVEQIIRKSKLRLKRCYQHLEDPFIPKYEGKWISIADNKKIKLFPGTPKKAHYKRKIASIECFEDIPCNLCQTICPTSAIQVSSTARKKGTILNEDACNSCGLCLNTCPVGAISLVHEEENQSVSHLTLPWQGKKRWKEGENVTLVNRRGESLGSARTTRILESSDPKVQWVEIDLPSHLLWDARGFRKGKMPAILDSAPLTKPFSENSEEEAKIEILFNGEKRLVRNKIPISSALFEMGQNRSEDLLSCKDGSCRLCMVSVDSTPKLACQTPTHRGMALKCETGAIPNQASFLCPCLRITRDQILERINQGKLKSPEAVLSITHVGEGKCHGQLCMSGFKQLLIEQGLMSPNWIDWRFPWTDWILNHNSFDSETSQF